TGSRSIDHMSASVSLSRSPAAMDEFLTAMRVCFNSLSSLPQSSSAAHGPSSAHSASSLRISESARWCWDGMGSGPSGPGRKPGPLATPRQAVVLVPEKQRGTPESPAREGRRCRRRRKLKEVDDLIDLVAHAHIVP